MGTIGKGALRARNREYGRRHQSIDRSIDWSDRAGGARHREGITVSIDRVTVPMRAYTDRSDRRE